MPLSVTSLGLAALVVGTLLVLVAVAVNTWAPALRPRLRTPVVLFGLYVLLVAMLVAAHLIEAEPAVPWLDFAARLFGGFCAVGLLSLLSVEVLLPRVGVRFPAIATDLLTALGYGVVVFAVATDTGVNATSALAGGTVVAAALTISLQSTLGNVIGGVALQLDGTVQVGDWVQLEGGREGRVAAIRWRHLVVETRDGDAIVVPNAVLLNTPITILGRRDGVDHPQRRTLRFRVDRHTPPSVVIRAVEEALRSSPIGGGAEAVAPDCVLLDLGRETTDSTLLYGARYWLQDRGVDVAIDSDVRVRVYAALARAGVQLATPATTYVNVDHETYARVPGRDRDRAYRVLRSIDLFDPLTEAECRQTAAALEYVPFADGEYVTRQGRSARHLYVLAAGVVEVRLEVDGREERVATLHAPDIFGEMGLLTGSPRTAGVVAVGPVECYELDHDAFQAVLQSRPEVAEELAAVTATRQAALAAAREGREAREAETRRETARILARMREFFGLEG